MNDKKTNLGFVSFLSSEYLRSSRVKSILELSNYDAEHNTKSSEHNQLENATETYHTKKQSIKWDDL
jgi:hypothetical protein